MHNLSSEEEALLAYYLLKSSDMRYGKTLCDVRCIVESYFKQKGSLRIGYSTAGVRLDADNEKNMDSY